MCYGQPQQEAGVTFSSHVIGINEQQDLANTLPYICEDESVADVKCLVHFYPFLKFHVAASYFICFIFCNLFSSCAEMFELF